MVGKLSFSLASDLSLVLLRHKLFFVGIAFRCARVLSLRPFAIKFCVADLSDKVKYLISVFSFVCLFNYCNRSAMLCSAALLFLSKLLNRIQFRCIALID